MPKRPYNFTDDERRGYLLTHGAVDSSDFGNGGMPDFDNPTEAYLDGGDLEPLGGGCYWRHAQGAE